MVSHRGEQQRDVNFVFRLVVGRQRARWLASLRPNGADANEAVIAGDRVVCRTGGRESC